MRVQRQATLPKTSASIGAWEVKLSALLGNYDRPTNQPTTGRRAQREVIPLPIRKKKEKVIVGEGGGGSFKFSD